MAIAAEKTLTISPQELLRRWPADVPILALGSGTGGGPWGRWAILAIPGEQIAASGAAVIPALQKLDSLWGQRRALWDSHGTGSPLTACCEELPGAIKYQRSTRLFDGTLGFAARGGGAVHNAATILDPDAPPFVGGWIGFIGFECGEQLNRAMKRGAAHAQREEGNACGDEGALPDLWFARCDAALVHDAQTGQWRAMGEQQAEERVLEIATQAEAGTLVPVDPHLSCGIDVQPVESDEQFAADVHHAIALIHAGDLFQVNVARRFQSTLRGPHGARALGAQALAIARYGAHLELNSRWSITSFSPELFLSLDPNTREIITRPIKGTRAVGEDERAFEHDAKECAELHMIVDLMRNDLGRVCETGSVRVESARHLEHHPTILHGVGEVHGTLREGTTLQELLRATFPPGSVTGAPKVRAVQVIRQLERARRGPYCGAIAMLSDNGAAQMSVAIRTAVVKRAARGADTTGHADVAAGATLTYWAGCGIVADSTPEAETRESHAKVAVVRVSA